jgi:hypothetical protein
MTSPRCVECGVDLIGAQHLEMVVQIGTGIFIRESTGDADLCAGAKVRAFCAEDCLYVWVTAQRLLANLEGSV